MDHLDLDSVVDDAGKKFRIADIPTPKNMQTMIKINKIILSTDIIFWVVFTIFTKKIKKKFTKNKQLIKFLY